MAKAKPQYDARFRQECLAIYLKTRTIAGVTRELKRRGYKYPPDVKTMYAWRDEERWDDRLRQNDQIESASIDPTADPMDALIAEVSAMRKIARAKIVEVVGGKTIIKDPNSQDFHAYNRLAETEAKLLAEKKKADAAGKAETPVAIIFEALKRHKKIGPILKNAEILSEIQDIIKRIILERKREELENI